jgi:hypothetical protein
MGKVYENEILSELPELNIKTTEEILSEAIVEQAEEEEE